MTAPAHTPGPWKATFTATSPSREVWANSGPVTVLSVTTTEANARLIAAAPDLLVACEAALTLLENSPLANSETAEQLRVALAKAQGEQS